MGLKSFKFDDVSVVFFEKNGLVGLTVVPTELEDRICEEKLCGESSKYLFPAVNLSFSGDGYYRKHNLSYCGDSVTAYELKLVSQTESEERGIKKLVSLFEKEGVQVIHTIESKIGSKVLEFYCTVKNTGKEDKVLTSLSSISLGGISPFNELNDSEKIEVSQIINNWSGEGRLLTNTAADLCLYDDWAKSDIARHFGIGQATSMPACGHLPFLALKDLQADVVWLVELEEPAAWNIDLTLVSKNITLTASGLDGRNGFKKTLKEGESYTTQKALLSTVKGDLLKACNLLNDRVYSLIPKVESEEELPVMYNEYLYSMGSPTMESIEKMAETVAEVGAKYFIMDAGWYKKPTCADWSPIGDWRVNLERFPDGLKGYTDYIESKGMKSGIWYEFEGMSTFEENYNNFADLLLKKDGKIILDAYARSFLDFRKQETIDHLTDRVIRQLKDSGIKYMKVDYNASYLSDIDGEEHSAYDTEKQIKGVVNFFNIIRKEIPDLVLEICASGGMRHSPAFLKLGSMCSFSDAHFGADGVPIAMGLHRVIHPAMMQIWANYQKDYSYSFVQFNLAKGMLGRICLSGDLSNLPIQMKDLIKEGVNFYADIKDIIKKGETVEIYDEGKDLNYLDGKQFHLIRTYENKAILYYFGIKCKGKKHKVDLKGYKVVKSYGSAKVKGNFTFIPVNEDYDCKVLLLERK